MLRGRTLAYPGLTVIVLSPCVVIPSVSPSDVSMSVFSWSHCQVCVSWHWDQLSLVRICSLHLLLFSVALSLMVVSSLTVCLLFWCKGLVLLVCLLVFFFHFSLIKPVMSLLLDSLSLVFGSKLCLALTLGSLYYCYGPWPRRKWAGLPVWKFKHARAHRWLAGRGTVPTQLDANHLCNCMSDLLV